MGAPPGLALIVPVNRIILASFVVAALLAGIAGVVARTGTGNPQIGNAYTLPALSAAFLGASTIRPGRSTWSARLSASPSSPSASTG